MDENVWNEATPDDVDYADIASLLDAGYEMLDAFGSWLEEQLELPERTVQRDTFNAEAYVDYLANSVRKGPVDANEYDLRWFVFSHYVRKSLADRDTAERLLTSLANFHRFLEVTRSFHAKPWLTAVLEDTAYYHGRLREYAALDQEDERAWEVGFRSWCDELEEDLEARCLAMPREIASGLTWSDVSQWREAALRDEANRVWQAERDRLIVMGVSFDALRPQLIEAYERWVHSPQIKLDDQSPIEVIFDEREASGLEEDDEGE